MRVRARRAPAVDFGNTFSCSEGRSVQTDAQGTPQGTQRANAGDRVSVDDRPGGFAVLSWVLKRGGSPTLGDGGLSVCRANRSRPWAAMQTGRRAHGPQPDRPARDHEAVPGHGTGRSRVRCGQPHDMRCEPAPGDLRRNRRACFGSGSNQDGDGDGRTEPADPPSTAASALASWSARDAANVAVRWKLSR